MHSPPVTEEGFRPPHATAVVTAVACGVCGLAPVVPPVGRWRLGWGPRALAAGAPWDHRRETGRTDGLPAAARSSGGDTALGDCWQRLGGAPNTRGLCPSGVS